MNMGKKIWKKSDKKLYKLSFLWYILIIKQREKKMKKEEAIAKGYLNTGMGSQFRDDTKIEIEKAKTKYPKAKFIIIRTKDTGLSRGGSDAWDHVYGDAKYRAYKSLEGSQPILDNHTESRDKLLKEYQEKVTKLNTDYQDAFKRAAKANEVLQ